MIDDFERALAADAPPEAQGYRSGVELIHRQLLEAAAASAASPRSRRVGQTSIRTSTRPWPTTRAEACAEGQIVGELRRGYRLGERLLRPALVRVAKAS